MSPQQTIAHYRILSKLGEGGMGAVYRAVDTKLNRDVAVKLLPETFAADAGRMARFSREAQVLASLNHPNIAAIYGVEDRALVLELVEGPTLADRIARGPIPVEDAIPIARQIAEALEYAHEKGVIHRDLKPANIKVTPEGRVKVLDFGLAKAITSGTAFAADPASSPTITMHSSVAGLILGTAGYMSPEQAKGKPADKRADIWAVFVAMLTGRAMYTGETMSEILASVIKDQPDLAHLPPATPSSVRRVLDRCLNKDPRRRLQAIAEARVALEFPEEPTAAPTASEPGRGVSRMWQVAVGTLGIALLAVLTLLWRAKHAAEEPMMRLSVDLGPGATAGDRITTAISPDGLRIVYPVRTDRGIQLATRLLDQSESAVIAGSDGGADPFFSPDGQWIGFFADGKMKKAPSHGGAPVTLTDALPGPGQRGAAWGDNHIIANLDLRHLSRVPAGGGKPEILPLDAEAKGYWGYRWPQILPGGDSLLVTASSFVGAYDDADIAVVSLKTRNLKVIVKGGYCGRALPTGHLVYLHHYNLMAVGFDSRRLETYGTPEPVVEGVAGNPTSGAGQFDVSNTGTLVYLSGKQGGDVHNIMWMDATGKQTPLLPSAAPVLTYRLSPDGARLAVSIDGDISVYDIVRGTMTRTHRTNTRSGPQTGSISSTPRPARSYGGHGQTGRFSLKGFYEATRSASPLIPFRPMGVCSPIGGSAPVRNRASGYCRSISTIPIIRSRGNLNCSRPNPLHLQNRHSRQTDTGWPIPLSSPGHCKSTYGRIRPIKLVAASGKYPADYWPDSRCGRGRAANCFISHWTAISWLPAIP